MPVLEKKQQLVELRAVQPEFFAGDLVTDVAALAVVSHLEGFERDLARVDLVIAAGLRKPRIDRAILLQQRFQVAMTYFDQVLQVFPGLFQVRL
jgi:hypothetical protein